MPDPDFFFPYQPSGFSFEGADPASPKAENLAEALLLSAEAYGAKRNILVSQEEKTETYGTLLGKAVLLSRAFIRTLKAPDAPVGLMLPTASGTALAFFGASFTGRPIVMMNFNAGVTALLEAAETAQLTTLFTSRAFIEGANLGLLVETLEKAGIKIVFLEDLAKHVPLTDKLLARVLSLAPRLARRFLPKTKASDPAVILFTSGSEGKPKGVVLSTQNILANITQFSIRLKLCADDIMFACLPLFHSFGLTVGFLLPVLTGIKTVFYATPLHYHIIPEKIRKTQATLMLSTDTFIGGYARGGSAEDFASLRYIVLGAEKVKATTHELWATRFGKTLLEGYGATETAPVLAVNAPDESRAGTVGRLLPGIAVHLQPVPGLTEGGSLCVKGPNIMLGYMLHEAPGIIQPPPFGWYDTGDIATLDADGYLTIQGRLKRFAKIGGEMISLSAVEQAAARSWPEKAHAVISIPHKSKGESLILVTEQEGLEPFMVKKAFRTLGLPEMAVPRSVIWLESLPLLGTGKIDYARMKQEALALGEEQQQTKTA